MKNDDLNSCPVEGPYMPETKVERAQYALDQLAAAEGDNNKIFVSDYDVVTAMQNRILKYQEQDKSILAILSELPDNTTPSSRYCKELILPRLNRIREILKS